MSLRGCLQITALAALLSLVIPQIECKLFAQDKSTIPKALWGNYSFGDGRMIQLSQKGMATGTGDEKDPEFGYPSSVISCSYFRIPLKGIDGMRERDRQFLQEQLDRLKMFESKPVNSSVEGKSILSPREKSSSILEDSMGDAGTEIAILIHNPVEYAPELKDLRVYNIIIQKKGRVRWITAAEVPKIDGPRNTWTVTTDKYSVTNVEAKKSRLKNVRQ